MTTVKTQLQNVNFTGASSGQLLVANNEGLFTPAYQPPPITPPFAPSYLTQKILDFYYGYTVIPATLNPQSTQIATDFNFKTGSPFKDLNSNFKKSGKSPVVLSYLTGEMAPSYIGSKDLADNKVAIVSKPLGTCSQISTYWSDVLTTRNAGHQIEQNTPGFLHMGFSFTRVGVQGFHIIQIADGNQYVRFLMQKGVMPHPSMPNVTPSTYENGAYWTGNIKRVVAGEDGYDPALPDDQQTIKRVVAGDPLYDPALPDDQQTGLVVQPGTNDHFAMEVSEDKDGKFAHYSWDHGAAKINTVRLNLTPIPDDLTSVRIEDVGLYGGNDIPFPGKREKLGSSSLGATTLNEWTIGQNALNALTSPSSTITYLNYNTQTTFHLTSLNAFWWMCENAC